MTTQTQGQLHSRQPGLVALEHHPEHGGRFGHIDIPKFGRRLNFSPVPRLGNRRVEYVPPEIADYMIRRFNQNGMIHLTLAHDLMNQGEHQAGLSKEQFRALLQEMAQEDWFAEAVRNALYGYPVGGPTTEPPELIPAAPDEPYVPKKRGPKPRLAPE